MSTPCTWIVRVAEDSTEPMIWPWITCLKTTGRTSHLSRWLLPICDRVLFAFLRCLINTRPRFWIQFSGGKLHSVPPCINSSAQTNWLNRGDVRKALHIPDTLPLWDICRYAHKECCESADVTTRTGNDPPLPSLQWYRWLSVHNALWDDEGGLPEAAVSGSEGAGL